MAPLACNIVVWPTWAHLGPCCIECPRRLTKTSGKWGSLIPSSRLRPVRRPRAPKPMYVFPGLPGPPPGSPGNPPMGNGDPRDTDPETPERGPQGAPQAPHARRLQVSQGSLGGPGAGPMKRDILYDSIKYDFYLISLLNNINYTARFLAQCESK